MDQAQETGDDEHHPKTAVALEHVSERFGSFVHQSAWCFVAVDLKWHVARIGYSGEIRKDFVATKGNEGHRCQKQAVGASRSGTARQILRVIGPWDDP